MKRLTFVLVLLVAGCTDATAPVPSLADTVEREGNLWRVHLGAEAKDCGFPVSRFPTAGTALDYCREAIPLPHAGTP